VKSVNPSLCQEETSLMRRNPQEHERSLDLMFPKSRCENDLRRMRSLRVEHTPTLPKL
jgi:hypothetical protein